MVKCLASRCLFNMNGKFGYQTGETGGQINV